MVRECDDETAVVGEGNRASDRRGFPFRCVTCCHEERQRDAREPSGKFRNFQRTACLTQKNTAPELKWSLECRRGRGVDVAELMLSRRFLDVVAGDSVRLIEVEFDVAEVTNVEA